MIVYFIVFIVTLLLSYFLPARNDKEFKWKLVIMFIPLFLFGALRVNMGNDYPVYEFYFEEFHGGVKFSFDETSHSEIGYQFLCYIMPSFRSILVLNTFLLCLAFGMFIYRNVPKQYIWVAVLIIFFNVDKNIYGSMVGLRNGFAVITFLLGSVFIQERRWLPFALITVVAMSFHTSAVFFLPVAYIIGRRTEITKMEITIWVIVLAVLGLMSSVGLLNAVTPFLLSNFDRYEAYIEDFSGHKGIMMVITTLILFYLIFTLFYANRKVLTPNQNSLIRLGLLYVASMYMGTISMRAGYFYNVFFAGTVATFLHFGSKQNNLSKILCVVAIIMSMYSMYLWTHAGHVAGNPLYTIYHSILD